VEQNNFSCVLGCGGLRVEGEARQRRENLW